MSTTQIVPKIEFDSPLETALATNDSFTVRLMPLKVQAVEMEVKTKEDYAAIGAILAETRSIRKNEISPLWSPFKGVVERVRDFLKVQQQKAENLCEEIDGVCRRKMKEYEIAEAKATAKEQKKHPDATVQADIPAVEGYRRSTTYPITIDDPKALLRALLRAYKAADTRRVQFLSQFVCLDENAIKAHARETKDVNKFNAEMPGITCRKEGA